MVGDNSLPAQQEPLPGSPRWWNARYQHGDRPWDTGIVPPEVERFVRSQPIVAGWALDLGCGHGTSTRFLSRAGFRAVGVDLSLVALEEAQRLASREGLTVCFCAGSVVDLAFLRLRATFALDVGCYHGLLAAQRPTYIASLARHLLPGALFLLYAHDSIGAAPRDEPGFSPEDAARFAPALMLRWTQHGDDRGRPSAWYLFQRTTTS